ncbi:MAG: alcohol dehydrogenase catalytic domain-containing protein, partial [Brevundimonas sp.]|nr:alcohol dehydrogenase catalytic domain-containing protein [Brevundimonas sp.]
MPIATRAFAATSSTDPLTPYDFNRRDPGPDDVAIEIKFAGVCHSDLHIVKNDLGN